MIFYDKKRTLYALLISVIVVALFIFAGIPLMYEWYHRKIYPFFILSVSQQNDLMKVSADGEIISWAIIQQVDHNKKKIIFTITWSNNELKLINEFPINGNIGYDMCYENQYGQYCFGETK